MPSTWQENLRLISDDLRVVTTPARNLWHGRIYFSRAALLVDARTEFETL